MKKRLWISAAVCFVLAALFSVLPMPWYWLQVVVRVAALPLMIGAVLLLVNALMKTTSSDQVTVGFEKPLPAKGQLPAPPKLPQNLPLEESALGSLRGAVSSMENMRETFSENPMLEWQFERICTSCKAVLEVVEEENGDAKQAADFAVQYLPSVMQYLLACKRERCPENAVQALARIAVACERQQDALKMGEYVTFEQEYYALRNDLQQAAFRWEM